MGLQGGDGTYQGGWVVARSVPSDRFRFVGASFNSAIYLFGGQGAFVNNLEGTSGGFPVHSSVMKYAPYTYTASEVTALVDAHTGNVSALDTRIALLEGLVASQANTIASLQTTLAQVNDRVGLVDQSCFSSGASTRNRRSDGCRRASAGGGNASSGGARTAMYVGIGVGVVVVAAVVAVVYAVKRAGTTAHVIMTPMEPVPAAVDSPAFEQETNV